MKTLSLLLVLIAGPALAQARPTVVDHPLDLKMALPEAQASQIQDDYRQLLAKNREILIPTRTNWKAASSALRRQDCDLRNECLRQLATTAGTLYALYVGVERNAAGTELTATGRVVNQDGTQVRAPVQVKVSKGAGLPEAVHSALVQLLAKLELEKLSPVLTAPVAETPKVDNKPATVMDAPPIVLVQAEAPGTSPLRIGAFVVGGLAVVAGGVAAGFGLSAMSARGKLPTDGRFVDDAQAQSQATVNQGATIALASGAAALALAATSVTLFIVSSPSDDTSISVAPSAGGATFLFTGRF